MDFTEPEHVAMLRHTLRRFLAGEVPRVGPAKWDKENYFPRDIFVKLSRLGVAGLAIPEEFGGCGRDIPETMVVIEELAKCSLALAIPYIMAACYAGMNV